MLLFSLSVIDSYFVDEPLRIEIHKKIQVEYFYECNTSYTPNVARKYKSMC